MKNKTVPLFTLLKPITTGRGKMEIIDIEIWKKCRESIEHFDKLLADFRRMVFTIEGVALPVGVTLLLSGSEKKILYIGYLSLGISVINILVWTVEKHYHLYLLASAKVAEEIEGKLGLDDKFRLTTQLRKAKEEQWNFKLSLYDFIYLIPALIALIISFLTGIYFWTTIFLAVEFMVVVYLIKRHHIR